MLKNCYTMSACVRVSALCFMVVFIPTQCDASPVSASTQIPDTTTKLAPTTEGMKGNDKNTVPHSHNVTEETFNKTADLPDDNNQTDEQEDNDITNDEEELIEESGVELVVLRWADVEYPLIITLVVIFAGLSKLGFHYSHFLSSKVPESCVLVVLGVISGVILYYSGVTKDVKLYAPHLFFLYLLPPIILEAAYSLYDRTFAENIGGVLLFAVLGTVLNCFLIGFTMYGLYLAGAMEDVDTSLVQMLLFTALIVAVDPVAVLAVFQEVGVNDVLYFLVFGESLLNDGVTVVLYDVMQIFITMPKISVFQMFLGVVKFLIVVLCGLAIGVLCGMSSSYITKFTNTVKVVEPLIVFGFAYLSYVLSDMFEFSGIISIIACGIVQVHYTFRNITKKSRQSIKFFSKVMANASEIIVFLDLGIVTINLDYDWKTGFAFWALFLCIVYRFLVTYSLSACLNKFSSGRVRKIRLDEMFMISYGGLRGAVCFSLVALIDEKHVPMKNLFVTTTLFIIFFTVFIQGGTIKWLVKKLRVKLAEGDPEMNLNREISNHVFDYIMAGIEQIAGYTTGDHHIKKKLDKIDSALIKPKILKHSTSSELEDISRCYEKLVMREHYKNLQVSGAKLPKVNSETIRQLEIVLKPDALKDEEKALMERRYNDFLNKEEQRNMEHNRVYGNDIHKFLGHTMDTVRDRLHLRVHDKNMIHESQDNLVTHLHLKEKYNSELRKKNHNNKACSSSPVSPGSNVLTRDHTGLSQRENTSRSNNSRSSQGEGNGIQNEGIELQSDEEEGSGVIVFTL